MIIKSILWQQQNALQRRVDRLESVSLVWHTILPNWGTTTTLKRHGTQFTVLTEAFQFYLLKASNELAKEKGWCADFGRTKYSDGILPIDTYKKEVDEITTQGYEHDWESLRASILEHGLRHSTLSAQMPSESSSVVSNATNGIEPPRDYLSVKKSKKGPLKQIVPSVWIPEE